MRQLFLLLLSSFFFVWAGCESRVKPIEGTREIAEEVERLRPRRILEKDMLQAAQEVGDYVVAQAQDEMDRVLPARLRIGGVAEALPYCRPEQYLVVDSMARDLGAQVRRMSLQPRNPANLAQLPVNDRLKELQHTTAADTAAHSLVQRLSRTDLIYTKPIYIRQNYCLSCHGQPGTDIREADLALIQEAYPDDEATGYRPGQLRGMWQITISQKGIMEYISQKKLRAYYKRRDARRKKQQQE